VEDRSLYGGVTESLRWTAPLKPTRVQQESTASCDGWSPCGPSRAMVQTAYSSLLITVQPSIPTTATKRQPSGKKEENGRQLHLQIRNHEGTGATSYHASREVQAHNQSLPRPKPQRQSQAGGPEKPQEQDHDMDQDSLPRATSHGQFGSRRSIDDLFHKTSDQVLQRVFGDKVAQAIAQRIQAIAQTSQDRGIGDAQAYSNALTKILGSGSVPIERLILKNIYTSLEQDFQPRQGYTFPDYLEELKHRETAETGSRPDQ
jgi:hypothetical protein